MVTIRSAGIAAIPVIRSIAQRSWAEAYKDILQPDQMSYMLEKFYSLAALDHQFNVLKYKTVLALDNNQPVGFATYSPKENARDVFKLHKIYLLPEQHGRGTGRYLLEHIIEDIKNHQANILELNVNRFNKARSFYEKLGFRIVEEVDIPIGNGYFMNDYVMQKSI
jgi:GNAT superfamily N-acetyltransferase